MNATMGSTIVPTAEEAKTTFETGDTTKGVMV